MVRSRFLLFWTLHCVSATFVVCALAGCGGETLTGSVSGKVSFQGQPIPMGYIQFFKGDTLVGNASVRDGNYRIERVPVGPVDVTVTSTETLKTASNQPQ